VGRTREIADYVFPQFVTFLQALRGQHHQSVTRDWWSWLTSYSGGWDGTYLVSNLNDKTRNLETLTGKQ
jgi:hypothetical protein